MAALIGAGLAVAALWWTLGTSGEADGVASTDLKAATDGFYELSEPTEGWTLARSHRSWSETRVPMRS